MMAGHVQVEVANAEAYRYDGEAVAKAKAMGKEGLVSITPRQVCLLCALFLEAKRDSDWGVTSTVQQNADASMHFHRSWS